MTSPRPLLVVEDDPGDMELTLEALRASSRAGAVEVARDGAEALDYLHCRGSFVGRSDGHPGAILLDLKIPKIDGFQVLRSLKSDAQLRLIPVVVLTSSREERDLRECYNLGVNAYVVKPLDYAEFMDAVRTAGTFWSSVNEPPPAQASGSH